MKTKTLACVLGLVILATCAVSARAEETTKETGSSWGHFGNTSPTENGNKLTTIYAEQGMVMAQGDNWQLSPYVAAALSGDTEGLPWNNKSAIRGGIKFGHAVPYGTVTLRLGVAYEHYTMLSAGAASPFASVEHWLGWGYGTRFPGSSWGVLGYGVSPAERNVSLAVHVEQGLFATKIGTNKLIPFVDMTIARDQKQYDWNNKNLVGVGVKYSIPMANKNGTFDVGVKYTHETRVLSGVSASNVGIFATYWLGW